MSGGTTLTAYQAVDGTEAQKREASFYQAGQRVYFLQRYGRYAKGELCEIIGANEHGVTLVKNGRRSTLSYRYTNRIAVVAPVELEIAPGDRLQLKFNGKSLEGHTLTNGELLTVCQVRKNGSVVVEDDRGKRKTLSHSQRLFNRGYAVTSYASQGKTVDTVLFADAANRTATNCNQWYVAISRGRKRVVVFTSDKVELRANIEQSGDRSLALDIKPSAPVVAPSIGQRVSTPEWSRRVMESVELARLHEAHMQFTTRHAAGHKISM